MKVKILIILILFLSSFITNIFCQNQYVDRLDPYVEFVKSNPVECVFPPEIKTVILEQTIEKEEVNFVKNLDENGRLYEFHSESDGNENHVAYTCSYLEAGASVGTYTVYGSNGKTEYQIVYEKNESGKPIKMTKTSGKGKLMEKIVWLYNDKGLLENTRLLDGDKEELVNEWIYSYDDNGQMIKTVLKDSKDRVEHEWLYNCNEEKKSVSEIKLTTQICSWKDKDDDHYLINEQRFDENGGFQHHIWRYALEDSTICAYLIYNETNKLDYKIEYDNSWSMPLEEKIFKDGKVDIKGAYKYVDGLNTNYSKYESNNQLIEHHLYIYNDEGFMTRARIYDDRNDNVKTIVIKYKENK